MERWNGRDWAEMKTKWKNARYETGERWWMFVWQMQKWRNADKDDEPLVVSTPMKHRVTADVHLRLTNIRPNIRLFSDIVVGLNELSVSRVSRIVIKLMCEVKKMILCPIKPLHYHVKWTCGSHHSSSMFKILPTYDQLSYVSEHSFSAFVVSLNTTLSYVRYWFVCIYVKSVFSTFKKEKKSTFGCETLYFFFYLKWFEH